MQTCQIIYEGRVQGVFFRATAVSIAADFDITGWVRNEPDGSVKLIIQGEPPTIDAYLDALHEAKRANIANITITPLDTTETFEGFTLRR
jgi:acylphosphatase